MRKSIIASSVLLGLVAIGLADQTTSTAEPSSVSKSETYIATCSEFGGTEEICSCAEELYRTELSDDLYDVVLLGIQQQTDAMVTKMAELTGGSTEAILELSEQLSVVAEKVDNECVVE